MTRIKLAPFCENPEFFSAFLKLTMLEVPVATAHKIRIIHEALNIERSRYSAEKAKIEDISDDKDKLKHEKDKLSMMESVELPQIKHSEFGSAQISANDLRLLGWLIIP